MMENIQRYKERMVLNIDGIIYEIWIRQYRQEDASITTQYRLRTIQGKWWQKKKLRWVREWSYGCQKGECWRGEIYERSSVDEVIKYAEYLSKEIE